MTDSYIRKEIQSHKKDMAEAIDAIAMNTMNQCGRDFKEYEEEVLDWSWDTITK